MPALLVTLMPYLLQVLVKYGPDVYNKIVTAIHKPNPTIEDWIVALETPAMDKLLTEPPFVITPSA